MFTTFHMLAFFKPVGKLNEVIVLSPGPLIYTRYLRETVRSTDQVPRHQCSEFQDMRPQLHKVLTSG